MRKAEPLAGLGGIVLLVSLFLPWYSPGVQLLNSFAQGSGAGGTGWEVLSVIDILLALLAVLAIAVPLATLLTDGPAKSIGTAVIASALGWIAVLLVLLRLIDDPQPGLELDYGAYVALVGSILAWVGSWLSMRDESTPGRRATGRSAPPGAMKAGGAAILFASLFLTWYTLAPTGNVHDFSIETAWERSVPFAVVLTVLALAGLRYRAAGVVAAVVVLAGIVFAPADDIHRDPAPWLALLGALTIALDKPHLVARLGAVAILGSLVLNWYDTSFLIITRGASRTETLSALDGSGPTVALAIILVACALLALARPQYAWLAIGVVVFWLIEPHDLIGRGAWVALAGSILAWGAGLMSSRPKITDQCSPATRSSTSPASPASS